MTDTTTAQLIAAAGDPDLRARYAAAAEARGLGKGWADQHMGRLVAIVVNGPDGQPTTAAKALDYAALTYRPTPRPGENLAAVLDTMLFEAIDAVNGPVGS